MSQGKKRVSTKAPSTRQLVAKAKQLPKRPAVAKVKANLAVSRHYGVSPVMAERKAARKALFGR